MNKKIFKTDIAGREFSIEFNELAEQANGSVIAKYGETAVLATCVMSKTPREGVDFFPLLVDYEERFYAVGKILGSKFVRREGKASDEAVLTARLIDRSIRPRFNQKMRNDVQIVITVLSLDKENDPDIPSLIGASMALASSNIPWDGPIGAVKIGKISGELTVNPNISDMENSELDLFVTGTSEKINMLEAGAKETPEENILDAIKLAHEEIKKINDFQKKIIEEINPKKAEILFAEPDQEFANGFKKHVSARLEDAIFEKDKNLRQTKISELKEEWMKFIKEKHPEDTGKILTAEQLFEKEIDEIVHKNILEKEKRPDGRKLDQLREIEVGVSYLPRAHGSGLFLRGQTHALSVLTLGSPGDEKIIEGMEISEKKRFMHHYNFPAFSTGEIKPSRGPGRRDIGHGSLAEKALLPLIPTKEEFPYTIRLVSEILSSNGSSSMASVCGSTLALMDGGVPIKKPAAGIAMGLMMDQTGANYKILTDIQGPEDHHGDMDLKVAGTKDGITALQMDVKIEGVTLQILADTFKYAKKARLEILEKITALIPEPRKELSPSAPRIITIKINPDKIGAVIGTGGKVINEIIDTTGATIDIEDDGTVFITSENEQSAKQAVEWVKNLTKEFKTGEIVQGKVVKITDFGAFVELTPGQDGLLHISELAPYRVKQVNDVVNTGDVITIKIKAIEGGKISLSLKDVKNKTQNE